MKKGYRLISMVLALTLLVSTLTGTLAFADETAKSVLTLNDFDTVETVLKNSRSIYEIEVDPPEVSLSVQSGDESVLKTYLQEDADNPGYYVLVLDAYKEGQADVTVTAGDGTTETRTVTVSDVEAEKTYTVSADLDQDFTVPDGNSRFIKIHYENDNWGYFAFPTLVSDKPEMFSTALVGYDGDDYYFQVDANGSDGDSAKLYIGSSDYLIPEELCTVTVRENKHVSVDTRSTYECNLYDSYHFIVYTDSDEQPFVTSYNDAASVHYIDEVPGGYEYEMIAEEEGVALIQAELDGETAAFVVKINDEGQPSVVTDAPKELSLEKGETYNYQFSIMGGGAPQFSTAEDGVLEVTAIQKNGIHYTVTVTAVGEAGSSTGLSVSFPDADNDDYTVNVGTVTVTEPEGLVMKSDTTSNFSLSRGASYVFRITGATSFYAGSSGAFAISKIGTSGSDTFFRITAIGQPGQATGLYMSAKGETPKKVCVVTVAPVQIVSDTNQDFELAPTASYQFKITAPGASSLNFNAGSSGVVKIVLVKHSGSDFYYKVYAVGKSGQQVGIYASVKGQDAKKLCVITIGQAKLTSDTTRDFSLAKGSVYQFGIKAPGVSSLQFNSGNSAVIQVISYRKIGDTFYYRIAAVGQPGLQTGIYATIPGQDVQKLCVVTVK